MDPEDLKNASDIILTDAIKNEIGKPIATNIGTAINGLFLTVFSPLVKHGLVKEQDIQNFKNELAHEASKIPENKLTDKNKLLALKTLEDSRFHLDEETLRHFFVKLIAASFNDDFTDKMSPVFSTILSQMSPKTAKFLSEWSESIATSLAVSNLYINVDSSEKFRTVKAKEHLTVIIKFDLNNLQPSYDYYEAEMQISELEYLGLARVNETQHYVSDLPYKNIADKENALIGIKREVGKKYISTGTVSKTPLGLELSRILFSE